jgi:creatinine amidohydrolase
LIAGPASNRQGAQSAKEKERFMMLQNSLPRRHFLELLAAGLGASALAGCQPEPVLPTQLPTAAPVECPPAPVMQSLPPTAVPVECPPPVFDGYSIFHETMVDLPWEAVQKAAQAGAVILLPVGIIEEHGPHLGLGPDVYLAYQWSKLTRRTLEALGVQAVIAPPFYWGINSSTGMFPGSFTVRPETFKSLLHDILASLKAWGFRYAFVLNLHGDSMHNSVLRVAIKEIHEKLDLGVYLLLPGSDWEYGVSQQVPPVPDKALPFPDVHAGAYETSQMAYYFPEVVDEDLARRLPRTNGFQPLGYWGAPAEFDAPSGGAWLEAFSTFTAQAIHAFLEEHSAKDG